VLPVRHRGRGGVEWKLAQHRKTGEMLNLSAGTFTVADHNQTWALTAWAQQVGDLLADVEYRGGIVPKDDGNCIGALEPTSHT
jgi:hypothetical protein